MTNTQALGFFKGVMFFSVLLYLLILCGPMISELITGRVNQMQTEMLNSAMSEGANYVSK